MGTSGSKLRRGDPGYAYQEAVARYGKDDHERIATPWFGQFPPVPEGWTSTRWCWRHWAPAPVLGANGMLAALTVISEMPALLSGDQRVCCVLGDAAMYRIWGKCPPAERDPWDEANLNGAL